MKTLLTLAALFIAGFASAQNVYIPDPKFKAALINMIEVNVNSDDEIQESEAQLVTTINLPYSNEITDITGIRSFTNLEYLTCWNNQLTNLDLSGLKHLKHVIADNNLLTIINISGCDSLAFLAIEGNKFTSLDFRGFNMLETLVCGNNKQLSTLNTRGCSRLKSVSCSNSTMTTADLRDCDSLTTVDFFDSYLQTLDVSGSRKLQKVLENTTVDNLLARGCTGLLTINSGFITRGISNFLDVTDCINLKKIYIQESNLLTLDVSTCINLKELSFYVHGQGLKYLNIKNGSSLDILDLGMGNEANELNICADEFEIADVKNKLKLYQSAVNVNSYCSFTPIGTYNTIQGKIRLDMNNNGCDTMDAGMPAVPLMITDTSVNSLTRYTSNAGDYAHYPYKGSFTLTPYFPYAYFTIDPPSTNINFDTANNIMKSADFCISPNGVHNDLEITFLPISLAARPGFDATYQLIYKNRGTTTLSGDLQLSFDNSKMNFLSASPAAVQNNGQLTWQYSNLQPFESKTIYIIFNLLPPPINNINDTIIFLATISPTGGDETPYDNLFILPQRIRGSYDPNDKLCIEGDKIDITAVNKPLHYVIHFQNLGNDTTFNVVVADTLSNKLDWNSFEFTGSSHPCVVKQTNNQLEFIFENIKLPYKSINEPASNGFVAFKIKPKNTVVIGDSLNNKAAIYFDFNLPVITNLATTIVSSATTPVPVKIEYFAANNKGSVNILNWKAACTNGTATFSIERSTDGIKFYSISKLTASSVRCQLPFNFTDKEPVAGKNHYRLKITDVDGLSFYSKTLVIGVGKNGLDIRTVVNTKNNSIIYFNSSKQQKIQLKLLGADGKLLYTAGKTVVTGNGYIDIQMPNLAPGIYTLIVYTTDGGIVTKRFIR